MQSMTKVILPPFLPSTSCLLLAELKTAVYCFGAMRLIMARLSRTLEHLEDIGLNIRLIVWAMLYCLAHSQRIQRLVSNVSKSVIGLISDLGGKSGLPLICGLAILIQSQILDKSEAGRACLSNQRPVGLVSQIRDDANHRTQINQRPVGLASQIRDRPGLSLKLENNPITDLR